MHIRWFCHPMQTVRFGRGGLVCVSHAHSQQRRGWNGATTTFQILTLMNDMIANADCGGECELQPQKLHHGDGACKHIDTKNLMNVTYACCLAQQSVIHGCRGVERPPHPRPEQMLRSCGRGFKASPRQALSHAPASRDLRRRSRTGTRRGLHTTGGAGETVGKRQPPTEAHRRQRSRSKGSRGQFLSAPPATRPDVLGGISH